MKGRTGCFLLLALLLALPALAEGTTRYVVNAKYGIPEDPQGLFEAPLTPALRIQAALDLSGPGDTVLVAGIGFQSFLATGGSYDESIHIPEGVALLGGWDFIEAAGGGDGRSIRYDSLWTFIVPPVDSRACRFDYDSTFSEVDSSWSYSGPDESTILRGFVLRSAVTNVTDGAGIMLRYGSPVIEHNVFNNNQTNGARGAGIFVGNGSPLIAHNTFGFCRTSTGSGVVHVSGGDPVVRDNIFYRTGLGLGVAFADSAARDTIRYNLFFLGGGRDTLGCFADETNLFEQDPAFCDAVGENFRIFLESTINDAGSDGLSIGAWGVGCRAGSKYVSSSTGLNVFPYDTPANAARTVEAAMAIANPGDTVKIAVGNYTENLSVPPGVTIIGGYGVNFEGDQVNPTEIGTVILPEGPDSPILDISAGDDTVRVEYLVLTGATGGDGAAVRVNDGTARFEHVTVAENASGAPENAVIRASGGSDVAFRYVMFADNLDGPLLDCEGGASVAADSCNFDGNTQNVADGCPATLTNSLETDALFCSPSSFDFRLFSESSLDDIVGGISPIGALSSGCNFSTHYVWIGGGAGEFPYETPEKATSDLASVIDIAEGADTIQIAAGVYETNVTVLKAITLQGGYSDSTFTGRDPVPGLTVLKGVAPGEPTVRFTSLNTGQFPRGGLISCVVTHEDGVLGSGVQVDGTARAFLQQNLIVGNRIDRSDSTAAAAGAGLDLRGGLLVDTVMAGSIAPELRHNTIVFNTVENAPENDHSAGGVYVEDAASGSNKIVMDQNIIAYNEGGTGGFVDVLNGIESNRTVLNLGWQNIDRSGEETNFFSFGNNNALNSRNLVADPDFCDAESEVFTISNCSAAAADTFSVTTDTVAGAFPVSQDCQCEGTSFLVNPTSQRGSYPFAAPRTAARKITTLTEFLNPGDTVKVSTNAVLFDSLTLMEGVTYQGGYNVTTFSDATRKNGNRTRIGGNQRRRVIYGGSGITNATVVDFFDIAGGAAEIGAGVFLDGDASPVFNDCGFLDNEADSTGSVLYTTDDAAPIFRYCLIYDNRHDSREGGAIIHLAGGGGTFYNNVISNNQNNGRAFIIENCAPEIYNNAITFNDYGVQSVGAAGTVFDHNNVFHNFRYDYDSNLDFTLGEGNISLEAYYCNRFDRVYTLHDHSHHLRAGRDGGNIGALGVNCSTPVHFVGPNGSDVFPYSTRATAAHSIQDALDVAALAGAANVDSIDEVRVIGGTYEEDLVVPTNVRLIGGFGVNYSPDLRNADSNVTVIAGLGDGPVVAIDSGVIYRTPATRKTDATTVEGFRITGGNAERGGGVYIGRDGSPVIRGNRIMRNTAVNGGGIYAAPGAVPVVRRNIFSYNAAGQGAGVYADTVAAPTSAIYENNTFFANSAGSDDAGIVHTNQALIYCKKNVVAFSGAGRAYSTTNEEPANVNNNLFFANPGGDTLDPVETSVAESNIFQIIADPEFCDTAGGVFGVFYSLSAIQDSTSVLQDSCAETWWGARGAGCTKPGHRFLVRQQQASVGETPVFPHVCKENAALTLDEVIDRVNAGDTVEVARSNSVNNRDVPHRANMYLRRPIVLRGGWDVDFSLAPDPDNPDSLAPNPDSVALRTIVEPLADGPLLIIEQDPAAATDSTLIIDSTTIIEGLRFRSATAQLENGGAIQVRGGASPTIRNNRFIGNETDNWGGAVSIRDAVSPRIYRNYFDNNRAGIGGGIHIFRTVDPVVRGNIVTRNRATDFGGIRLEEVTGGSVDNNVFYRNAGGGISLSQPKPGADITVANNAVTSNGGYGISLFPSFAGIRKPVLTNNDVWANGAGNYLNLEEGSGDISVRPQYCNVDNRDNTSTGRLRTDFFRYQECSPLLYAGRDTLSDLEAHIGVARASDPTCADTTGPELTIGFLLHGTLGGVANLFVVPSESVARDSIALWVSYGDILDLPDSIDGGTDSVEFDTRRLPLRLIDSNPPTYTSDNITLRSSDSLVIRSRAVDLCGQTGTSTRLFSSRFFKTGHGGALRSTDKRMLLDVPADACSRSGIALLEVIDNGEIETDEGGSQSVSASYQVNFDQMGVRRPVLLTVDVAGLAADETDLANMALFRLEEDEWVHQVSTIDPAMKRVNAEVEESGVYEVRYSVDIASAELIPARFELYPNMPNPFNPTTRILFDLPVRSSVKLEVYDVRGRLVRTLHRGDLPAGRHSFTWDGKDRRDHPVGSGVYFYRLDAGDNSLTRKMILIR